MAKKYLKKSGLLLVILSVVISFTFALPSLVQAAKYTMVIAHHYPVDMTNNEVHPALHRFKTRVETETKSWERQYSLLFYLLELSLLSFQNTR